MTLNHSLVKLFLLYLLLTILGQLTVNNQSETYVEKLGFSKGKKVGVFHVDDVSRISYESNRETINALDEGIANSTSVIWTLTQKPLLKRDYCYNLA